MDKTQALQNLLKDKLASDVRRHWEHRFSCDEISFYVAATDRDVVKRD